MDVRWLNNIFSHLSLWRIQYIMFIFSFIIRDRIWSRPRLIVRAHYSTRVERRASWTTSAASSSGLRLSLTFQSYEREIYTLWLLCYIPATQIEINRSSMSPSKQNRTGLNKWATRRLVGRQSWRSIFIVLNDFESVSLIYYKDVVT
jgi:hypothetical protein